MEKMRDDGKPVLVTELGLSTRVTHLLQRNGIHSVAILERMGDESLMLLRGMGPGMFAEIRSKVPRPKKSDAEELAAYRATGLTPEEIMEVRFLIAASHDPEALSHLRDLVLADEDGRCVVLPCKVGDAIWVLNRDNYILVLYEVLSFSVCQGETFIVASSLPGSARMFNVDDVGKTVFMTREAAEAALEGGDA